MPKCPTCHQSSPIGASECQACGSLLASAEPMNAARQPFLSSIVDAIPMGKIPVGVPVGKPITLSLPTPTRVAAPEPEPEPEPDFPAPPDDADQATLVAHGDEARTAGARTIAFQCYERVLNANVHNRPLLEKMIEVAEQLGEPVRLSRCLATMTQIVETSQERAEYLYRAAIVTRDGRKQPEKAAAALNAALDLDPSRLDVFVALTETHTQQQDWDALEQSYRLMIGRHTDRAEPNAKLLGKLWRKLATILADNLNRLDDALLAIEVARKVDPYDKKNHSTVYDLYKNRPDKRAEAIEALTDLIWYETDTDQQARDLRELAELYIQAGNRDGAFCALRALCFIGEADEREVAFVNQLRRKLPKVPDAVFDAKMWARAIYPPDFPFEMTRVFALIAPAVGKGLEHELSYHKVGSKDRLDASQPLLFNNLMKQVANTFGLDEVPEIYVRDDVGGLGLINGVLDPPGFICDRGLLSGRSPQEVAFAVARLLALQKQDLYLSGISPAHDLQVFILAASRFVRPAMTITMSKDIEWIGKKLGKLDHSVQEELRAQLGGMLDRNATIDLDATLALVDETANRLAFIIADDLETASNAVVRDVSSIGPRGAAERMERILRYSVSTEYIELRQQVGLAVA